MPRVPKTIEQGLANYRGSIGTVPNRYIAAVERADWQGPAGSQQAEQNFATKMQEVISTESRRKGVMGTNNAFWRSQSADKGGKAIAGGMTRGADRWAQRFAQPYNAVLGILGSLPPKGTDPMANIDARLKPVVQTFVDNKVRGRAT